jgi:hypothetical protein
MMDPQVTDTHTVESIHLKLYRSMMSLRVVTWQGTFGKMEDHKRDFGHEWQLLGAGMNSRMEFMGGEPVPTCTASPRYNQRNTAKWMER